MCNLYDVTKTSHQVAAQLGAELQRKFTWANPITSYNGELGPGMILNEDGRRDLVPMQFSLTPSWSKEQRPKFASNNTRIEDVEKKKTTFLGPFKEYRCVVPLSRFREPCYWGDGEGKELWFEPLDGELLGVASIFNLWRSPDGEEEIYTMSMLMRPACEYIMDLGHHRQPFFVEPDGYDAWMEAGKREPMESKKVLRNFAHEPELKWSVGREMADSWTKRQKAKLKNREDQLAAIKKHGPLGF